MIVAHERSHVYGGVLEKIQSVLFFGTPHRGSDLAWWANFAADLTKALELGRGTNTNHSEAFKRNSEEISHISQQWAERSHNIEIRTYYETERLLGFLVSLRSISYRTRRCTWQMQKEGTERDFRS